ncbi:interleukin 13 receptor alpha 1 [Cricetulus griseus]
MEENTQQCPLASTYSSLGKILQCENIYREGQRIGCSFKLTKVDSSFEQHSIQIMVKDNAGKIRPSFKIVPLTSCGKEPNSTFYITMLLIIPVIVAGAIIVLLLYLKRLKIIIFPPIPDPGKIFKEMFGDQNDDTLLHCAVTVASMAGHGKTFNFAPLLSRMETMHSADVQCLWTNTKCTAHANQSTDE